MAYNLNAFANLQVMPASADLRRLATRIALCMGYATAADLRAAATVQESPSSFRDRDAVHGAARYCLELIESACALRGRSRGYQAEKLHAEVARLQAAAKRANAESERAAAERVEMPEAAAFNVRVVGGSFGFTVESALGVAGAAKAVRAQIEAVGRRDALHTDEATRALDFWTVEEISGDLVRNGLCDVLINGGYYTVEARAA